MARRRALVSSTGLGTKSTATVREGRSTDTVLTPSSAETAFSTLSTQDAQCMPETGSTTLRTAVSVAMARSPPLQRALPVRHDVVHRGPVAEEGGMDGVVPARLRGRAPVVDGREEGAEAHLAAALDHELH